MTNPSSARTPEPTRSVGDSGKRRAAAPRQSDSLSERRAQRLAWERVAAAVHDFHDAPTTRYYRRCEEALIRRQLGPLDGRKVLKLDLWNEAHNTRILHWMAAQGADVYALDLSQTVASRARRNSAALGLDGRMVVADIREIPFADGSFDALYTMGTIEHIDEYRDTLREIRRVLKPGGRAIVGVPHKWNLFLRPLMVELLARMGQYLYAPEKSFSSAELRRDLEGAGLRVVGRSGILTLPGLLRMADLYFFTRRIPLYRASPLFVAPFDFLETRFRWPGRFGYLMAMTVERPASA